MKYLFSLLTLIPIILMLTAMLISLLSTTTVMQVWRVFIGLSVLTLACTLINISVGQILPELQPWLKVSQFGTVLAFLVQSLCTVIATFFKRYLEGEPKQQRYVTALASVMVAVHLLLMADHWVILISAWALVGFALEHLLCLYPNRAFALLAAHKKQITDRAADVMLITACILAWCEVGSGSLSDLWAHIDQNGMSTHLQFSAVCLVLAVILRTVLLPANGWLIQVMEAPTPVSA